MRRSVGQPELLDGPLDDGDLRGNLRDLARFNRWFAGVSLSWRAIELLLRAQPSRGVLRMLDVGTGAGDIPIELVRRARQSGRSIEVVATDVRPEIVAIAAANVARAQVAAVSVLLSAPDLASEEDRSFDVAHSSLVLHHHDPDGARSLLAQMARVSRAAVIVNDLDRGTLWWIFAWLLAHLLTRNRYTHNDAPMSVRRAYRPDEMSDMAASVGLREVARYRARPAYRYALVFVRADADEDG